MNLEHKPSFAIGKERELSLQIVFLENDCQVIPDSKTAKCDFTAIVNGESFLIEAKNEDRYKDSGNICVEFYQNPGRKPSGISVSEATVWIHTLGERAVLYRTQPMRLWLKREQFEIRPFSGADNGNEGIIIPISRIKCEPWADLCQFDRIPSSRVFDSLRAIRNLRLAKEVTA